MVVSTNLRLSGPPRTHAVEIHLGKTKFSEVAAHFLPDSVTLRREIKRIFEYVSNHWAVPIDLDTFQLSVDLPYAPEPRLPFCFETVGMSRFYDYRPIVDLAVFVWFTELQLPVGAEAPQSSQSWLEPSSLFPRLLNTETKRDPQLRPRYWVEYEERKERDAKKAKNAPAPKEGNKKVMPQVTLPTHVPTRPRPSYMEPLPKTTSIPCVWCLDRTTGLLPQRSGLLA
jgi:hypothetical protein